MRFHGVQIAGLGHDLAPERVTSEALEERLRTVYERLGLRIGRLELMSGIRERRFYPPGERPSAIAARAGRRALEAAGVDPARIGLLVHASVSRDFLEPATASVVHHALGLPDACQVFDLSNACLGVLNGMVLAARSIEAGAIEAALVVAGEDGRALVEETVRDLVADEHATRDSIKPAFASLTIGSGGAAVVLVRAPADDARGRLVGGALLAETEHHVLCQGDTKADVAAPSMATDSEALLQAGNALAARTFERLLATLGWERAAIDHFVTHQVGSAHRRLLFETLALDPARDHPTVERLGNTGSAALPAALSLAVEAGAIRRGERVALLGIGSGLNCLMLGVEW